MHQLHILCWPDYLIPEKDKAFPMIESLIEFITNFNKQEMENKQNIEDNLYNLIAPTLIHCRYYFFYVLVLGLEDLVPLLQFIALLNV